MIDRRNRMVLALIGLVLFLGGGVAAATGLGAFGTSWSDRRIFYRGLVHDWTVGGWESFATVVAIGVVAGLLGAWLLAGQLRRNDGRSRTPNITLRDDGARGETTLRAPALSHRIEDDLERIPDVHKALVGLFGRHPDVELRAVLDVGDDVDLDGLPARVDEVLERMRTTTGVRPEPVQITVRFTSAARQRQLA